MPSPPLDQHPPAETGEQHRSLPVHQAGRQLMAVQARLQQQLSLLPSVQLQLIAVTAAGCRDPSPPAHTLHINNCVLLYVSLIREECERHPQRPPTSKPGETEPTASNDL